jgi:hypothetical protein
MVLDHTLEHQSIVQSHSGGKSSHVYCCPRLLAPPCDLYDLAMKKRCGGSIGAVVAATLFLNQATASAGIVVGHLDLPPASGRTAPPARGFVTPQPNLLAPPRAYDPSPWMAVVLDGDTPAIAGRQITLDLVGERFSNQVIAIPLGTDLVIKNMSKTPRFLTVAESPTLLDSKVLNPSGTTTLKPVKIGDVYTIRDTESSHVSCTVVVTKSGLIADVGADGKFDMSGIPDGKYTLKVFYRSGWIDGIDNSVTISGAGKVDVKAKVPAGFPLKK